MYEVEMKAELNEKEYYLMCERLEKYFLNESEYFDLYFDNESKDFLKEERELRIRKVRQGNEPITFLTFKDKPFDKVSKSKPEYEVIIDNPENMKITLEKLGYVEDISFLKECKNYLIHKYGYDFQVSLVYIEELKRFFIETEINEKTENGTGKALDAIYKFLDLMNADKNSLTNEYYTDAVRLYREK